MTRPATCSGSEPQPGDLPPRETPFWSRCANDACRHCWIVCYLPMEMTLAARLMKAATCPMCGSKKAFVAKQDHGVLTEEAA